MTKDTRGTSYYLGSLLAILVMAFFGLVVPTWGPVTELGVSVLGIFLGIIVAVIFTGETLWPAIVAIAMLSITGYYPSINAAISGVFGHPLVYSFFLVTALINAMNDLGAGKSIASILLTRKFFQKKPLLLSFCFLVIFSFAVNFMNTVGTMLLAFPILDQILDYADVDRKSKYAKFMNLGVFIAICLGFNYRGAVMPDFLMRINWYNEALAGTGHTVNLGVYTIYMIITGTLFLAAFVLSMKYVFKCDFGKLSNTDFREIQTLTENAHMTRQQIYFIIGFLVFALFGMLPKTIPLVSQIGQYGILGVSCITLAFMKRTDEDGNKVKLFNFGKYLQTVNWDIAMALGIFSVLGTAIGSDACGIKAWLIETLGGLLESNGAVAIALICIVGISIITQVFNNNATGVIFCSLTAPLAVPFVVDSTLNPALLLGAIALCAQSGFLTMAASGTAPIIHKRDGIDNKFMWTGGLYMEVLFVIVTLITFFGFNAIL